MICWGLQRANTQGYDTTEELNVD